MKPQTTLARFAPFATLALSMALSLPAAAQGLPDKGSYKIDAVHSQVLFTVGHLNVARLTGRFDGVKGEFSVDGASGAVKAEIDAASVNTGFADRDKHLRSPDFFNAAQFPKITFESTSVHLAADGTLAGNLTLHGVTRPVTLKLSQVGAGKDPWGGYRSGFVATGVVKRSDYGMKFMLGPVGDEIEVRLNIEAIKQ